MSKHILKNLLYLKVTANNFKDGEDVNVKITFLDEDENELGKKSDTTKVKDKKANYPFIIEDLAKSLSIKPNEIRQVKGWIDGDGDDKIGYNEEVTIEIKFEVINIPDVMRDKLNWPKSAELMELWFSLDEKAMTASEKQGIGSSTYDSYDKKYVNTTMFSMDWLLGFKSVQEGFNNIKKSVYSENARITLKKKFKENIQEGITSTDIKDLSNLHNPWHFQNEGIGYKPGVMDDLYGSLGNFALYAAVSDYKIEKLTANLYRVNITEVVVYMKDTYEFIGEQYLGHWNHKGMGINLVAGLSNKLEFEWKLPAWNPTQGVASSFGNSDFREYRKNNKKGGDLLLFSDIKKLAVNISFKIEM